MDLGAFHVIRRGVQANGITPSVAELAPLVDRLDVALQRAGLFEDIEVGASDNPDALIMGLFRYRSGADGGQVQALLEGIWEQELRYPYWEAHASFVERGHVEFQGATLESADGQYATFHLVAQETVIPGQRRPSDARSSERSTA